MNKLVRELDEYIESIDKVIKFKIGKSQAGNDILVKTAHPCDIWFHVHDETSAHIIACIGREYDSFTSDELDEIIKTGASLYKLRIKKYEGLTHKLPIVYTDISSLELTKTLGMVIIHNEKIINT
jgi:hypothetical protein